MSDVIFNVSMHEHGSTWKNTDDQEKLTFHGSCERTTLRLAVCDGVIPSPVCPACVVFSVIVDGLLVWVDGRVFVLGRVVHVMCEALHTTPL